MTGGVPCSFLVPGINAAAAARSGGGGDDACRRLRPRPAAAPVSRIATVDAAAATVAVVTAPTPTMLLWPSIFQSRETADTASTTTAPRAAGNMRSDYPLLGRRFGVCCAVGTGWGLGTLI